MRVLALSDIHVDGRENLRWIEELSPSAYRDDVLLLAGDVSHRLELLGATLDSLRQRFAELFYVPGNHDLWIADRRFADSMTRLEGILELCRRLDVRTGPEQVGEGANAVRIAPLLSWYEGPEHPDTLYLPKPGEDPEFSGWRDTRLVRWPGGETNGIGQRLLQRNEAPEPAACPLITMSHFLPRREVMLPGPTDRRRTDPLPAFNFSRYAGSYGIDRQLRAWGAVAHVYGHQHRNRARQIDGVLYVSHCLGTPRERSIGAVRIDGPRTIWESGRLLDQPA